MKHLIIACLTLFLVSSCQNSSDRYTQQSPEIDTVKQLIKNYNNQAYDLTLYADTSKTFYNTKGEGMSPKDVIAYHQANDANYSKRGFVDEDQEYEMVKTDDGEVWVNCWLDWKGTLKMNDKEIMIPVHLTYRFLDGKITREVGMWDPTEVVMALQGAWDINEIKNKIDKVVADWNAHNVNNLKSLSVDDLKRSSNGITDINNINEYESFMNTFVTAFPDFTVKVDDYALSGNKIFINWTVMGTHNGDFMGNAPTGKKMTSHGMSVWTLNNKGQFMSEDAYFDNLTLFNQLGISPPK